MERKENKSVGCLDGPNFDQSKLPVDQTQSKNKPLDDKQLEETNLKASITGSTELSVVPPDGAKFNAV